MGPRGTRGTLGRRGSLKERSDRVPVLPVVMLNRSQDVDVTSYVRLLRDRKTGTIEHGLHQSWIDRPEGFEDLSRLHDLWLKELAGLGPRRRREPSFHSPIAGARDQLLRHRGHVFRGQERRDPWPGPEGPR